MTNQRNPNQVTVPIVNRTMTKGASMPISPNDGDIWFNTNTNLVYTFCDMQHSWIAIGTTAENIEHRELKNAEAEENFDHAMGVVR